MRMRGSDTCCIPLTVGVQDAMFWMIGVAFAGVDEHPQRRHDAAESNEPSPAHHQHVAEYWSGKTMIAGATSRRMRSAEVAKRRENPGGNRIGHRRLLFLGAELRDVARRHQGTVVAP